MAQWVNRLQNNIFINPPPLPLLCEITAGMQAGKQAGGRHAVRRNTNEF